MVSALTHHTHNQKAFADFKPALWKMSQRIYIDLGIILDFLVYANLKVALVFVSLGNL